MMQRDVLNTNYEINDDNDNSWDSSSDDVDVIKGFPGQNPKKTSLDISNNNNRHIITPKVSSQLTNSVDLESPRTPRDQDEYCTLEDEILEKYLTDESDFEEITIPEPDDNTEGQSPSLQDVIANVNIEKSPEISNELSRRATGPVDEPVNISHHHFEETILENYMTDDDEDEEEYIKSTHENSELEYNKLLAKASEQSTQLEACASVASTSRLGLRGDSTGSSCSTETEDNSDIDTIILENKIIQEVFGEETLAELNKPHHSPLSEEDIQVRNFLESPIRITGNDIPISPGSIPPPFATLTMNLSFAGCGFLGIYHLGVAHSLVYHGSKLLMNVQKFGGASAGSLIASALAIRGPDKQVLDECIEFCFSLAETVRNKKLGVLTPGMSLLDPLHDLLDTLLPEDAHTIAKDRLFVSVTCARTKKNSLISEFQSKSELIKYLLGSSYVPRITGKKPVRIGNQKIMDGGMTDNMPDIPGGRTILVTPFSGRQHICPQDRSGRGRYVRINGEDFQITPSNLKRGLHAFFPPKRKVLERYLEKGKLDCIRFLKKENFYEEEVSVHNKGSISGTSPPLSRDPLRPNNINDMEYEHDIIDLDIELETRNSNLNDISTGHNNNVDSHTEATSTSIEIKSQKEE